MQFTLSELAEKTGAGLSGSGDIIIEKVADVTSGCLLYTSDAADDDYTV